jgi:hypothetical protein
MRPASVLARRVLMDADRDLALRIIARDTTRDLANLKARAKRAAGASAGACYGRALYEDVGDALGVELVKVGRCFIYRTRGRP